MSVGPDLQWCVACDLRFDANDSERCVCTEDGDWYHKTCYDQEQENAAEVAYERRQSEAFEREQDAITRAFDADERGEVL